MGGEDSRRELRLGRGPARHGLRGGCPGRGRGHGPGVLTAERERVGRVFRQESGRAVGAIARAVGDLDLAEEAVQDAFLVALERWPLDGVPRAPGSWIVATARNRAIDRIRRQRLGAEKLAQLAILERAAAEPDPDPGALPDERLELIFACCHPALAREAQVALTLRFVAGLETGEIARAFLVPRSTMAQRLVRAKRKISAVGIPFSVPPPDRLAERLGAVLSVVYLTYNQAYLSPGEKVSGLALDEEAIRLNRLLALLLPAEPEVLGLLSLLLLQHARRASRLDASGRLVPLEEQDRALWDSELIADGAVGIERALRLGRPGPYVLQAAIAFEHARAVRADETDWDLILGLYDRLASEHRTPVVMLNRAVALAMSHGLDRGLAAVDRLAGLPGLEDYHLFHATRGELLRRLGRVAEARPVLARAVELTVNPAEKALLAERLAAMDGALAGSGGGGVDGAAVDRAG